MGLVVPQSWDDVDLATAAPTDTGPLLAIAMAIGERATAAGVELPENIRFDPGDAMRFLPSESIAAMFAAIQFLRRYFVNSETPYNAFFSDWPDLLASSHLKPRGFADGVGPSDYLTLHPAPIQPESGDSDFAATPNKYTAFLQWARAALSAMRRIEVSPTIESRWEVDPSRGPWISETQMLAAASLVPSIGGVEAHASLYVVTTSSTRRWAWESFNAPGDIYVQNRSAMPANAYLVSCGLFANPQWDTVPQSFSGNAPCDYGPLGGYGVSATPTQIPAGANTLVSSSQSARPLNISGIPSPNDGNYANFSNVGRAFLDFSSYYRFP